MNKEQLQFFYDEIMGELGWGDEEEESGVDPLLWAKDMLTTSARLYDKLRAENKNHRDMNLLMNDTNNRLRTEVETWKTAERLALGTVASLQAELDKANERLFENNLWIDVATEMNNRLRAEKNKLMWELEGAKEFIRGAKR